MITVQILINGRAIFVRSALNITTNTDSVIHTYCVDDGKTLKHKRVDGAIPLAIKMLKGIKEPTHGE